MSWPLAGVPRSTPYFSPCAPLSAQIDTSILFTPLWWLISFGGERRGEPAQNADPFFMKNGGWAPASATARGVSPLHFLPVSHILEMDGPPPGA